MGTKVVLLIVALCAISAHCMDTTKDEKDNKSLPPKPNEDEQLVSPRDLIREVILRQLFDVFNNGFLLARDMIQRSMWDIGNVCSCPKMKFEDFLKTQPPSRRAPPPRSATAHGPRPATSAGPPL